MHIPSSPICLLLLIAFASHHVSPSVAPGGDAAQRLEADLFEETNALDVEGETFEEPSGVAGQEGVLMPAGWRRFRRSIRRRIRRIFRKPRRICFPYCPKGPKKGRESY